MNRIRHICHSLAGLPRRAGVLLASAAAAPAVLAVIADRARAARRRQMAGAA